MLPKQRALHGAILVSGHILRIALLGLLILLRFIRLLLILRLLVAHLLLGLLEGRLESRLHGRALLVLLRGGIVQLRSGGIGIHADAGRGEQINARAAGQTRDAEAEGEASALQGIHIAAQLRLVGNGIQHGDHAIALAHHADGAAAVVEIADVHHAGVGQLLLRLLGRLLRRSAGEIDHIALLGSGLGLLRRLLCLLRLMLRAAAMTGRNVRLVDRLLRAIALLIERLLDRLGLCGILLLRILRLGKLLLRSVLLLRVLRLSILLLILRLLGLHLLRRHLLLRKGMLIVLGRCELLLILLRVHLLRAHVGSGLRIGLLLRLFVTILAVEKGVFRAEKLFSILNEILESHVCPPVSGIQAPAKALRKSLRLKNDL